MQCIQVSDAHRYWEPAAANTCELFVGLTVMLMQSKATLQLPGSANGRTAMPTVRVPASLRLSDHFTTCILFDDFRLMTPHKLWCACIAVCWSVSPPHTTTVSCAQHKQTCPVDCSRSDSCEML